MRITQPERRNQPEFQLPLTIDTHAERTSTRRHPTAELRRVESLNRVAISLERAGVGAGDLGLGAGDD